MSQLSQLTPKRACAQCARAGLSNVQIERSAASRHADTSAKTSCQGMQGVVHAVGEHPQWTGLGRGQRRVREEAGDFPRSAGCSEEKLRFRGSQDKRVLGWGGYASPWTHMDTLAGPDLSLVQAGRGSKGPQEMILVNGPLSPYAARETRHS